MQKCVDLFELYLIEYNKLFLKHWFLEIMFIIFFVIYAIFSDSV